ncbi:MAG: GNAT family N-acetyltransferase [Rhodocyclaceae bacterium]|nr:GNAT family N-acetyltransferase [Rhodocyclaceae bacterium]
MHSERHYLTPLFEPQSIAIVGASERGDSIGATVVRNILEAAFKGRIYCINPRHHSIFGQPAYAHLKDLPERVDLAVICTRAALVNEIVAECGKAGVRYAMVISGGFSEVGPDGIALEKAMLDIARRYRMRILGPNCLGLVRPANNVHLSFTKGAVLPGTVGLISQSGALTTAVLDWAAPNKVGFSAVVSLGTESDVDFGEALDYLVSDHRTENIFLYIESIRNARRFMSALRAAARIKPVLLIKVGRNPAGERAIFSHTGALVGNDDVFDAALQRAGVVRLQSFDQLYAAVSALYLHLHPNGNRLAIVTNGGGPGAMAADHAADIGIPIASLTEATLSRLDAVLPSHWPRSNPVDIIGDADPARFGAALEACLADPQVDGALVILTPQAMSDPTQAARVVIEQSHKSKKPLITCWMGEEQVREGRLLLRSSGLSTFRTPEPAVEMFAHITRYYRNQKLLMQVPTSVTDDHAEPLLDSAKLLIETALAEGRTQLSEMESKALLAAFHIPIARAVVAHSADEAARLAHDVGLPVAMKVVAAAIAHKAEAGGVRLNLHSLNAVRGAYEEIIEEVRAHSPSARIDGISIEPMVLKANGRELLIGVIDDRVFGPAITLAAAGANGEPGSKRVVALPPLNRFLVSDMLNAESLKSRLGEQRNAPAVDMESMETLLLRVSEMVCELPWIKEMEISPLIVDDEGAVAVDARIILAPLTTDAEPYDHMAIHPYPSHFHAEYLGRDGTRVAIRPIRPEDAQLSRAFVDGLSPESRYFRFMNAIRELSSAQLIRLTQIDYDREMAFIAIEGEDGAAKEVGAVRYAINPDGESCEFAIVVADDWQGKGLARRLMELLIQAAQKKGLQYMTGEFLAENSRMLKFVASLGFELHVHPDDPALRLGIRALK